MDNNPQHMPRSADRRVSTGLVPPPYETSAGRVPIDRRSAIDRRASWIRSFSLDAATHSGDHTSNPEN